MFYIIYKLHAIPFKNWLYRKLWPNLNMKSKK